MRLRRGPMDRIFRPYSLAQRSTVGRSTRISSATSSVVSISGWPLSKWSMAVGSFIFTLHILYHRFDQVKAGWDGLRKRENVSGTLRMYEWVASYRHS